MLNTPRSLPDRLRPPRRDLGQGTSQGRELDGPADEQIGFLRHEHVLIIDGPDDPRIVDLVPPILDLLPGRNSPRGA